MRSLAQAPLMRDRRKNPCRNRCFGDVGWTVIACKLEVKRCSSAYHSIYLHLHINRFLELHTRAVYIPQEQRATFAGRTAFKIISRRPRGHLGILHCLKETSLSTALNEEE